MCTGKDVLDCGCVGGQVDDSAEIANTSHYHIVKAAHRAVGVDIVADEVEKRRAAGFDVRVMDVEKMELGERFDVVVAADLIEHLSNPGLFLDRAWRHLRDGGLLCLVTPNAWSANGVFKALVGLRTVVNPEHTCWYDPETLRQFLGRHGFDPLEWYWQDYGRKTIARLLTRLRPNLAAHFIVIAKKRGTGA